MPTMSLGTNGLVELKVAEGFMPRLYNDGNKPGEGHCTVGYGHLVHYDPCNGKKFASESEFINGITVKAATALLRTDCAAAEAAVNKFVKVALTQNQFDALVMFVFNVGRGAFFKSTLLRKLNLGDFAAVPNELRRWNKSGGKVFAGLINRREREVRLFQKKEPTQ